MVFKVIFIFSLMFWYCFPGLWSSMHGVVGVVVIIYQLCLSECGECVRVIFVMAEYKQIILLIIDCRMRGDSWRCCVAGLQDCVGAAHMSYPRWSDFQISVQLCSFIFLRIDSLLCIYIFLVAAAAGVDDPVNQLWSFEFVVGRRWRLLLLYLLDKQTCW